mgnify:FL=1
MPYTKNNDVKIYFEAHGKGEPLVLIQGLGGTTRSWESQIRAFAKQYQVILIDNRGAGQSDKPDAEYSIELFAQDIKCVLDQLEITNANLLGISMGGFIAQSFYKQYPQMVKSLILACTGVGLKDPNHQMFSEELHKIMYSERNEQNHLHLVDVMHEHFFHPSFREKNATFMQVLSSVIKADIQPYHSYKRQIQACYAEDGLSKHLSQINVPTLIIHAQDDLVVPIKNGLFLASNIPNAKLSIIPEAGHMLFIEKSEKFNSEVLLFLEEHKSTATCRHNQQIHTPATILQT